MSHLFLLRSNGDDGRGGVLEQHVHRYINAEVFSDNMDPAEDTIVTLAPSVSSHNLPGRFELFILSKLTRNSRQKVVPNILKTSRYRSTKCYVMYVKKLFNFALKNNVDLLTNCT